MIQFLEDGEVVGVVSDLSKIVGAVHWGKSIHISTDRHTFEIKHVYSATAYLNFKRLLDALEQHRKNLTNDSLINPFGAQANATK